MIILSLKSDLKRRESIRFQLKKLNLSFNFFDAITPKEIPDKILKKSIKSMTNGEVACAYSHIKIYEKIVSEGIDAVLIVEDDAIFSHEIKEFLQVSHQLHSCYDVIIVGYSKVDWHLAKYIKFIRPSISVKIAETKVRIPYKQWHCGTVGYSISKKAAKKMIEINGDIVVPADYWDFFEKSGLKIAHYKDILITEDYYNFDSHLEGERKTYKKSSMIKRLIGGIIRHFYLPITFIKSLNFINKFKI